MEKPTLIWGQYEGREEWINENVSYHTALFNELTDANGDFTYPNYPMVLLDVPDPDYILADFTGVTLCFDPQYENWATSIEITMHIKESGVSTYHAYTFTGTGPYVWCPITPTWDTENDTIVDFYVIIYSAHRPNSRLRFTSMRFGHSYEIPNDFLRSLDVSQSCDLSGISAPFSKMTATIDAAGLDAILGYRQKIELKTNIRFVGEYWVDSIAKAGTKTYTIIALDALGCLASQKFPGANYSGAAVSTVLDDIVGNEYFLNGGIFTGTVTGLIPECDRRTALNNLAISYGGAVLSKFYYLGLDEIGVFSPMTNPYGGVFPISPEKTYINPALVYEDQVTSYTITSHSFAQNTNGDVAIGNTRYRDTRTENTYTRSVPIGNETKKTVSQATLITSGTPLTRAKNLLAGRYDRQMVWKGSFIWAEDSGDHSGRLGAWVRIYDSEGHEIRGAVQKADLVFSGASIKVNAEILSFQLLQTPTLYYDEMEGAFTASYPDGDECELYKDGELVTTFQDEYYTNDPGEYYVVSVNSSNGYSYHSNTITIE